jgi:hypothetical protein
VDLTKLFETKLQKVINGEKAEDRLDFLSSERSQFIALITELPGSFGNFSLDCSPDFQINGYWALWKMGSGFCHF